MIAGAGGGEGSWGWGVGERICHVWAGVGRGREDEVRACTWKPTGSLFCIFNCSGRMLSFFCASVCVFKVCVSKTNKQTNNINKTRYVCTTPRYVPNVHCTTNKAFRDHCSCLTEPFSQFR